MLASVARSNQDIKVAVSGLAATVTHSVVVCPTILSVDHYMWFTYT